MKAFGSGVLLGYRTDIATQTPINFGLLQEMSMDISQNLKPLYGQYKFPVAIGAGQSTLNLKATAALISAYAFNSFFFGMSLASGQTATAFAEAGTIPGTPYQVTVANSAAFVDDYGVFYSATGLPLKKVASGPTTGQYSVSAGVYTFAAADTTLGVRITYTYTVSGTGQKFVYSNQLLGTAPYFAVRFYTTFDGKPFNLTFYKVMSSKLSISSKLEDFMMPGFEMQAFANDAGDVFEMSFGEVS